MINKKIILILSAVTIIAGAQVFVLCSRPKVEFKPQAIENSAAQRLDRAAVSCETSSKNVVKELALTMPSKNLPAICLNLELVGTAVGNVKDPIAFIKDVTTNKQGIYKTGSNIGQAKVLRIAKGLVNLDVNGTVISLEVKNRKTQITPSATGAIVSVSGDEIVMSRMALLNEAGNIFSLAKKMKIKPYKESAKVVGMKVDGVTKGSVIEQAGIFDKDVLTAVNNQKIDSYQKALQIFNKVKNQKEIKVSLLRDGQFKQLCYKINN